MQGLRPFVRYFDFSGRSGRAEFWQFVGLVVSAITVGFLLDTLLGQSDTPALMFIVMAVSIVPYYAVSTRRLHDRGWSGKWLILQIGLAFLSYGMLRGAGANAYTTTGDTLLLLSRALDWIGRGLTGFFLYLAVCRSEPGSNVYGPPPSDSDDPAPTVQDIVAKARQATAGAGAPPTAAAAAKPSADPLEQIERLTRLRDAGALTEDEFQQQKGAFLRQL